MNDTRKTKDELIRELRSARRKVTALEKGKEAKGRTARKLSAKKEPTPEPEHFQDFLEDSPLPYQSLDKNGNILDINQIWLDTLGYKRKEVVGRHFSEFLSSEYHEKFRKCFRQFKRTNTATNIEMEMAHKKGTRIPVSFFGKVKRNKKGAFQRTHCMFQDIAGHKEMEEALKKSYDELRLILDATTEGIWQRDFMKNKLYFSEKWYTMLGYEPFEFPASHENWKALLHPEDREQALAVAEKYLETKPDKHENEFRLKTKDGQYRWIRSHAKVVERDKNGEAVRLIGHHQDITEYKLAEEIIKDQAKFLKTLIDTIPIPVFYKDREGHYNGFNKAFETFVGKSGEQMLGKNVFEVYEREPREIPERYYESDQELLKCPGTYHYEWKMMNVSGELRDVIIDKATILGDRNSIEGIIGVMTDITQRKKAENILTEKMHELERLNRLFIGREHRMVELKKEVNALIEQLGQKKKYKAPDQAEPSMGPGAET